MVSMDPSYDHVLPSMLRYRDTFSPPLPPPPARAWFNSFPNVKVYTLPNSKTLQTTILNLMKMVVQFSKRVENTVVKGAIPPFLTVYSKEFYCRHVKSRACLGKGYLLADRQERASTA